MVDQSGFCRGVAHIDFAALGPQRSRVFTCNNRKRNLLQVVNVLAFSAKTLQVDFWVDSFGDVDLGKLCLYFESKSTELPDVDTATSSQVVVQIGDEASPYNQHLISIVIEVERTYLSLSFQRFLAPIGPDSRCVVLTRPCTLSKP